MNTDGYVLLGAVAWLGMLIAPPIIARALWKAAVKRNAGWVLHVLFPVVTIVTEASLAQIVFFAAHDDGEGPPGLGLALIPPLIVLVLTIFGYAVCVAATAVRSTRHRNFPKAP